MPQISLLEMAIALKSGPALVSFPTDTVPALATYLQHSHLIYAAKRRPLEKPLILMGASFEDLLPYVQGSAADRAVWQAVTEQHWPGQLTLVLPARDSSTARLSQRSPVPLSSPSFEASSDPSSDPGSEASLNTIGIRVPNHPIALDLLARTGPLATTSANLSGQPPLISPVDIAQTFPEALVLSDEALQKVAEVPISGLPSTVVKWTDYGWQVLRQGTVKV